MSSLLDKSIYYSKTILLTQNILNFSALHYITLFWTILLVSTFTDQYNYYQRKPDTYTSIFIFNKYFSLVCHLRLIFSLGTMHCGIAFTLKNSYIVAFSFGIIMQPTFCKSLCDYDASKDSSLGFGKERHCQRIKPLTSLQAAIWLIYSPSVNTMFWPSACRPEKERDILICNSSRLQSKLQEHYIEERLVIINTRRIILCKLLHITTWYIYCYVDDKLKAIDKSGK